MPTPKIDLQPTLLDLALYAGDGVAINMTCKVSEEEDAATVDMSGAVEAQIRLAHMSADPAIEAFAADMTNAATGVVVLTLTKDQTRALSNHESSASGKFLGVWDVQWTPTAAQPRTIVQGKVECVADVTR